MVAGQSDLAGQWRPANHVLIGQLLQAVWRANLACLVQFFSDQLFRESRCGENLAV
jgi:hypothetical protein